MLSFCLSPLAAYVSVMFFVQVKHNPTNDVNDEKRQANIKWINRQFSFFFVFSLYVLSTAAAAPRTTPASNAFTSCVCLLETERRRIWEIDREGISGSIFSLAKGFEKSGFLTLRLYSIKFFDFFSCIIVLFSIMCGCDGGSFIGWFDALYCVHHSTHLIAIVGFMDIVHNRCNSVVRLGENFQLARWASDDDATTCFIGQSNLSFVTWIVEHAVDEVKASGRIRVDCWFEWIWFCFCCRRCINSTSTHFPLTL